MHILGIFQPDTEPVEERRAFRRDVLSPIGGGKPPQQSRLTMRTIEWAIGMALAAIVAYYTTVNALETKSAVLEEREQNHYHEMIQRLDEMRADIKDLKAR